jgi:hypothetical protein
MGIQIPNAVGGFAPTVPSEKTLSDTRVLHEYLQRLTREVTRISDALFDNDKAIIAAINSGTSGVYTTTIVGLVVTSGLIVSVTT